MNGVQRYKGNSPVSSSQTGSPRNRRTAKEMERSDEATLIEARYINNRATLEDYKNEVGHQLALNEAHREAQRRRVNLHYRGQHAIDVVQGLSQVREMASMLGRGDPSKEMDYQDIADAYKAGEIRRMILGE